MKEFILSELIEQMDKGLLLLDIRKPNDFAPGFITGSIFLSPEESTNQELKNFFHEDTLLVIIAQDYNGVLQAEKIVHEKSEIQPAGFYIWNPDDFEKSRSLLNMIIQVDPNEFMMDIRFDEKMLPVDLRNPKDFEFEHLPRSKSITLGKLADVAQIASLNESSNIYFYGEGDHESLTAASLLKSHGIENVRTVSGGWQAICHDPYFKNLKMTLKGKKKIR